jgi:hypothetical protein
MYFFFFSTTSKYQPIGFQASLQIIRGVKHIASKKSVHDDVKNIAWEKSVQIPKTVSTSHG